jgi:hypothetical protein
MAVYPVILFIADGPCLELNRLEIPEGLLDTGKLFMGSQKLLFVQFVRGNIRLHGHTGEPSMAGIFYLAVFTEARYESTRSRYPSILLDIEMVLEGSFSLGWLRSYNV